jgi:hypothetical protein
MLMCLICLFCLSVTPHPRSIKSAPHVTWIDNYSNIIQAYVPTSESGAWIDALRTGIALVKFMPVPALENVSLKLVKYYHPDGPDLGEIVPAMPKDLYDPELVAIFKEELKAIDDETSHYHQKSLVSRYDVRCIPPKPSHEHANLIEDDPSGNYRLALSSKVAGLRHFFPERITDDNIGSNNGLAATAATMREESRKLRDSPDEEPSRHYKIITADCNIHWRFIKVPQHSYML